MLSSSAAADGDKKEEDILQVKVIPADLSDESLNLLPKDSFSHACVIGKLG